MIGKQHGCTTGRIPTRLLNNITMSIGRWTSLVVKGLTRQRALLAKVFDVYGRSLQCNSQFIAMGTEDKKKERRLMSEQLL